MRSLMNGTSRWAVIVCILAPVQGGAAVDQNNNQQSDVWEMLFQASGLSASADFDGDGWSNGAESSAGTDPRSGDSHPDMDFQFNDGNPWLSWPGVKGKRYALLASDNLVSFSPTGDVATGTGGEMTLQLPPADGQEFFRMQITDTDTDGDGVNDWEELSIGFDPTRTRTDRYSQTDSQRVIAGLSATSTITAGVYDNTSGERWQEPATFVLRRGGGGLKPLLVNFSLGGAAVENVDYQSSASGQVSFSAGQREAFIQITALVDEEDEEGAETVVLTVLAGTGYTVGGAGTATVSIMDQPEGAGPSAKEAARFLVQAAFGPDQDDTDADDVPENVETVMAQGFSTWLDNQFAIPPQYHEPFVEHAGSIPQMYMDPKMVSWWNRALGTVAIYPGGPPAEYDPVRQRVAYSLSQIFVVSDRPETLAVEYRGMANYYDMLVRNALGNYRDLLFDVATHPVMGFYLSHVRNKKADPTPGVNTFPDENFAREVQQLFSIGLWELEQDGTRKLDELTGQPIPTYTNVEITNFARVFTGLSYGPQSETNFNVYPNPPKWLVPMRGYDAYHDLAAKSLLKGVTLPPRMASNPDVGTATMLDVNAAIDNLFNHPNVGPFIGRQLIQRLVTANPSKEYIGRVAAAFADNGSGVRGDMKAFIKAILLDPEARDAAKINDPEWGKPREPFLRCVNYGRAFNAHCSGPWDFYQVSQFNFDQQQQPYNSPSVFNFYSPNYLPPGVVGEAGLVAPEFQILNATTAVSSPNYFYNSINSRDLHRWGTADATRTVRPNFTQEAALAASDVDGLIRRLDMHLTCGGLSPREFQSIREAVTRVDSSVTGTWQTERVNLAVYLITTSPAFCILR